MGEEKMLRSHVVLGFRIPGFISATSVNALGRPGDQTEGSNDGIKWGKGGG